MLCVLLLWLAGNGLRITILAVPPVIPLIRADLGMTETMIGILTGLPPVLFACTAVLGSLLIARFGALNTLIGGLIATAAGSALRGVARNLMKNHLHHCAAKALASGKPKETAAMYDELLELIYSHLR